MTYEQLLQQQPPSTSAGDLRAAKKFVDAITTALVHHQITDLNVAKANYLYRLRAKWQVRAEGKDATWNIHGSKPGRKKKPVSRGDIDTTAYGDEDELDPLLASLKRKYGKPGGQ